MTIYGRGYRDAVWLPVPASRRWLPLAQMEFRSLFRSRWGIGLFVFCLLPSIINLVLLLVALGVLRWNGAPPRLGRRMGDQLAAMLPDRAEFFVESITERSLVALLILTALVGCRAIAKDRASNALELYWTRGIGPGGYFAGKWLGSFLLLLVLTVAAPLLVWLTGVLVAEDWGYLQDTVGFMPRVLLAHALFAAALAWLSVAVSGLMTAPNFAMVTWLLLVAGSGAVAGILGELVPAVGWLRHLGLWAALGDTDRWIAGTLADAGVAPLSLAAWLLLPSSLLLLRLRRQEAVR